MEKDAPASAERADSSSASPSQAQEEVSFCSEHTKEKLKLFCETCGELICFHCALKTSEHHSHDYMPLKEGFEQYKKKIHSLLEPIEKLLLSVDEVLTQFERRSSKISDQRAAIEADIHCAINELHQVLDVRRTELIGSLHQLTQMKLKEVAAQRDRVETIHAQLKSCLDYMEKSIETDCKSDALKMKTTVLEKAEELTTTVQPANLQPNTEADIKFYASADITASCRQFGQVALPSGSPDSSKCRIAGKGLEAAEVGQKASAILQVFNSKGEPCDSAKALKCKLVSDITDAEVAGSFTKLGLNQYEISYQPTIKGRHQLHITAEGQHVRGSPFAIAVTSFDFDRPLHSIAGVKGPWSIAINSSGQIVVSERKCDHISSYCPSGTKIRTIRVSGLGGIFSDASHHLSGLTCDRDGNIIVSEEKKHSIRKYSPRGKLLASVGSEGTGKLRFKGPSGIAVNTTNNKVYIADRVNHRIQVLNSDFTFSAAFGENGRGKGQFQYPRGIACDSAGNVYVVDSGNHRIQVFTTEGEFLKTFGQYGKGQGELDRPIGIALDPSNSHVFVSEYWNMRISVFTVEGQLVTSFGCGFHPYGLAVDSCSAVYVCNYDGNNNCVQIY